MKNPTLKTSLLLLLPLLLSALLSTTLYLSQPRPNLKPKIFVLGLSKTGTTSVGNALALLGYKRIGWKDIRSRHLVHTFIHGDHRALVAQTKYFDAFEDLPWPFMYAEMAERYPDAKFVLSLRKDEQTWLKSMRRHMGRGSWEPAAFFYGAEAVDDESEGKILDVYRNHTAAVRAFFASQPERYSELIVDSSGAENWASLCAVAQCPAPSDLPPFPKSNTAAHWHDDNKIISTLGFCWGWTITRIEELSARFYYGAGREWWAECVRWLMEAVWEAISVIEIACCEMYFQLAVENQPHLQGLKMVSGNGTQVL